MTKILDIQESIIAANGNVALAKELFTMLIDDLKIRLQQIETSVQSNNMETLKEHIHKLYGATAYCKVPKLRKCTAILDGELKQKNCTQINQLADDVIKEINNILSDGPDLIEQDWETSE